MKSESGFSRVCITDAGHFLLKVILRATGFNSFPLWPRYLTFGLSILEKKTTNEARRKGMACRTKCQ